MATDLFNYVWALLEKSSRTPEEDDEMIHAAHTSRYLWGIVGRPENWIRGEWQCSRVYAVLGRGEAALHHASRCRELCDQHRIGDFDLAFAYEALARAHRVNGDAPAYERFKKLARKAAAFITDPKNRAAFDGDLATL